MCVLRKILHKGEKIMSPVAKPCGVAGCVAHLYIIPLFDNKLYGKKISTGNFPVDIFTV